MLSIRLHPCSLQNHDQIKLPTCIFKLTQGTDENGGVALLYFSSDQLAQLKATDYNEQLQNGLCY